MTNRSPFRCFKTSPEIIRLAALLYIRFPLTLPNVQDCSTNEVGRSAMKRRATGGTGLDLCSLPRSGGDARRMRQVSRWLWHLDEMYVKINDKTHYLWRAVITNSWS